MHTSVKFKGRAKKVMCYFAEDMRFQTYCLVLIIFLRTPFVIQKQLLIELKQPILQVIENNQDM